MPVMVRHQANPEPVSRMIVETVRGSSRAKGIASIKRAAFLSTTTKLGSSKYSHFHWMLLQNRTLLRARAYLAHPVYLCTIVAFSKLVYEYVFIKRFLKTSPGAALSFGISCYQAVKLLSAN